MQETVTIASNAVVAKLIEPSKEARTIVHELLSYVVEGAGFSNAFTSGHWNGKSSFYSMKSNTFPAGFVPMVEQGLGANGIAARLVSKKPHLPLGEPPVIAPDRDTRYDYQFETLAAVEKYARGIIQIATGGGKSVVAKLIAGRYRRMTLFLTTRSVLMWQMRDHYTRMGINCGILGDGEWSLKRGINCGMVQTLVAGLRETTVEAEITDMLDKNWEGPRADMLAEAQRRVTEQEKKRTRMIKILSMFEVVIGEEAHEAGGNSYFQILKACSNATIRVALTATPFMRDDAEDNMKLMAAFGSTLIRVSEKQLIDSGILATPIFKFVTTGADKKLTKSASYQRAIDLGFINNPFLNGAVADDAAKAKRYGLPVLTLVQRRTHGIALRDLMRGKGLRAVFLQGENKMDERRRALEQLRDGEIDVLIGTTILDVGVDVPAIGLVQLAGGGKAEVALRQRIGRGLRAKKTGPNLCFVADYAPGVNTHLRDHASARRRIVESTPGFVENILGAGQDFPWAKFAVEPITIIA